MNPLTNKYNLFPIQVRMIEGSRKAYNKGDCDFSATELLQLPRARILRKKHGHEIKEDVSDYQYTCMGSAFHEYIAKYALPEDIVEKRFFATVNCYKISAQIDYLDTDGNLIDWKSSKTPKFMKGKAPEPEWVAQMNIQAWILEQNGIEAKKLFIGGYTGDFSHAKKLSDPKYPEQQMPKLEIKRWDKKKTFEFIVDRIEKHLRAENELPRCGSAETWSGRRCNPWCSVRNFCSQYQETRKTGIFEGDNCEVQKSGI